MSGKKPKVVVLGAGPNGLGIVRALHALEGLDVWNVDINGTNAGRYTRYAKTLKWNYLETDIHAFESMLNGLNSDGGKIILFPTRDLEVTLLGELSSTLPDRFLYYRNAAEKVNALADKNLVDETARRAGLDLPKTCFLTGPMNPLDMGFHFPVIMKPLGQNASQTPFKNYFAKDLQEFNKVLETYEGLYNNTIIQEFIPGGDDHVYECILLVDDRGQTIAAVEFQKIRQYLPMRGMTSFGRTLLTRDMVPLCERLTRLVGYTGLIDVELRRMMQTGDGFFLKPICDYPYSILRFRPAVRIWPACT
jgi:D-aspartate ligase